MTFSKILHDTPANDKQKNVTEVSVYQCLGCMDVWNNESYIVNIYSNTEKFHFAQIVMTGLRIKKQYLMTAGLFWMKLGFCVKISVLMGNHMTVILLLLLL